MCLAASPLAGHRRRRCGEAFYSLGGIKPPDEKALPRRITRSCPEAFVRTAVAQARPVNQEEAGCIGACLRRCRERALMPALLNAVLRQQLLANGGRTARGEDIDPFPVVKLFMPDGSGTWLLTELDPAEPTRAFSLCDPGLGSPELGYVCCSNSRPFGADFVCPWSGTCTSEPTIRSPPTPRRPAPRGGSPYKLRAPNKRHD